MKRRLSKLSGGLAMAAVLFFAVAISAQQNLPSAHELAQRVDQRYDRLQSLKAGFNESYAGLGMTRTESGTLFLRKPGRMMWQYSSPPGKIFLLDGKYALFYAQGDAQVQRIPASELDDLRSPLRFLLGHTELEKELTGLTASPDGNGNLVLSGVPKGLEQRVSALKITAGLDGTIRSMTIEETDGVTNRFEFSGEAEDVPAPNAAFVFVPPAGVHVVVGEPPV